MLEVPEDTSATTAAAPSPATAAAESTTAHQVDARVATIRDAIAEITGALRDLVSLLKGQLGTRDDYL